MKPRTALPPAPNRRRASAPPRASSAPTSKGPGARRLRTLLARIVSWASRALVAAAVVAGVAAAAMFLHHYVTSSEHFQVREIQVTGAARVGRDEILNAGRIAAGDNVFRIDLDGAAARIRALPWIREAVVRRRLPGEISIKVVERQAAALVELGGLYLVDGEGNLFKRLGSTDPDDLPVVTGLTRAAVRQNPEGAREALVEALGLVTEVRESGLETRAPVSEVHRDGASGWSIVLAADGTRVQLGQGPYRQKLARLGRLLQELGRRRLRAEAIYLDNQIRPDRATVRLRAPEPTPENPG